jgi:cbb3-type cytochrome oxidase subunit 3
MKSQVLSNIPWPSLSIAGFFIFLLVFCGVIYWTFRKGSKEIYKNAECTPFDEGEPANRS